MSEEQVEDCLDRIDNWPSVAKGALTLAQGTERFVDVLGQLNKSAGQVSSIRRRFQAEVEDGEHGELYLLKRGRQAKRTYNLSGILLKFQEKWQHVTVLVTLMRLIEEDVIRISFQWTNLRKLAADYDVPLSIVNNRKVESGDPDYDVGEEWFDSSPSYEPLA